MIRAADRDSSQAGVIEASSLGRSFGRGRKRRHVLSEISLEVGRGEIFGVLGADGAGKTTLVQMLAAILDPSEGNCRVLGYDTVQQAAQVTSRIGYMAQGFTLYGTLSVAENLTFFAGAYRLKGPSKRDAIDWAIRMTGLDRWQHHRANDLSGAIRQRLALACSVMHRPAVLFLDEPTSGVAPSARRRFWQLIYRLAAEGIAVLVTTHYLEEATYCHRLGLMHAGRLVVAGTQEELRAGLGQTAATTEEIFLGYIERQRAQSVAAQAESP